MFLSCCFFQIYRLATPIANTDPVKPISYNTDPTVPSDGQSLNAYGFGLTEDGGRSDSLREADFQYITNQQCLGETVQFSNVIIGDDVMCVLESTASLCQYIYITSCFRLWLALSRFLT